MTQYFVETSATQPQLFVFGRNIEYKDEAEEFETILNKFENNFNEEQERNWLEYWEKQGEEIILQEWKLKYKDYLANETVDQAETTTIRSESNCEIEERIPNELVTTETIDQPVEEYAESWLDLWQQHSEEIYSEQYILYTSLYYNYYSDFKKSILTTALADTKQNNYNKNNIYTTNDLAAEIVELKLLGLPTAFGGRHQSNSKHCLRHKGRTTELYNIFFSDDDDENDIDEIENTDDNDDINDITVKDHVYDLCDIEDKADIKVKKNIEDIEDIEFVYSIDDIEDTHVKMDLSDIEDETKQDLVKKEQNAVGQDHDVKKELVGDEKTPVAVEEAPAKEPSFTALKAPFTALKAPFATEKPPVAVENEQNNGEKSKCSSEIAFHKTINKAIAQKAKKNRKLRNVPAFLLEDKGMLKYWRKRFSLFSRYDDGIRLDRESWFSVTPEKIAVHIAERLTCDILIDGFCGCGGNAIQLARTCRKVIAIDIDPLKLEMAKHNAGIYGVADKIDFILGDFLQLSESGKLKGDIVFLSPPWGGPMYKKKQDYDIESNLLPVGATTLIEKSRNICENIALFLPRTSNIQQVIKLAGVGKRCEIEHNYLDSRLVAITAMYGEGVVSNKQ